MYPQTATNGLPAGAGISVRPKPVDKETEQAKAKSLVRYAFSAGEAFGLGDRLVGLPSLPQGRLALIDNYTYSAPNLSDDFILKGQGTPQIRYTKPAYDCADEIVGSFTFEGTQAVFIIASLTGVEPATVIQIEKLILPELPATLKQTALLLRTAGEAIQNASMPEELRTLAQQARLEMYSAAVATISFQNRYLDRAERELINSRKPNGHGKSSLDDRDRHFYQQLQRPVPKEADLEYVAEQEGAENVEQSALSVAISRLTSRLDADAESKAAKAETKALKSEVSRLTKLVEGLVATAGTK